MGTKMEGGGGGGGERMVASFPLRSHTKYHVGLGMMLGAWGSKMAVRQRREYGI